ncbi:MAG: FUSC family protein, partial [Thermodesulfobacteriota bacterium]
MNLRDYLSAFRVKIALKITLGGVIAALICNIFHLPSGFLAPVILYMIMAGYHGKTFEVGIQSLIGCLLSGFYSLFIIYYFLDSVPVYLILAAIWIFGCITFIGKYPIASVLSAILTAMSMFVAVFGTVAQTTASVENYMVQLFVAAAVSWLVDEIIWPLRSGGAMYLTLSTVYKDYAVRFESYIRTETQEAKDRKFESASVDVFNNLVNLVRRTERETRDGSFHAEPALMLVAYAKSIYIKLDVLDGFMRAGHKCLEDKNVSDELNGLFALLSEGFTDLASAIVEGRSAGSYQDNLGTKIGELKNLYEVMHSAEGKDQDYFEDLLAFGAILPLIEDTVEILGKAGRTWNLINSGEYDKLVSDRVTRSPAVESIKSGWLPQITRASARQSAKSVMVIMLLLFGELLLKLPGGYQASFYGVLFGSIPNTGQAHLRGK